jgi:hypothetical protein
LNEDIRYIHKTINGQEVFYFANIGNETVNTPVTLRGNMKLQSWDPHTGNIRGLGTKNIFNNKTLINSTNSILKLKACQSVFWIEKRVK